jgi:hypothetical protein
VKRFSCRALHEKRFTREEAIQASRSARSR